jgi:4-nitrophenyl phosphatase
MPFAFRLFYQECRMISKYIASIKGLIVDMDGVLWRDTEPIGDLPGIFERIDTLGLKLILATNNSSRTVDEYLTKLSGFGVNLEEWQVINSSQAVGIHLQRAYPEGCKVYVIGEPSLKRTLEMYGLTIAGGDDNDTQVVVAAIDTDLTYEKLKRATLLLRSGCEFIGTNADATFPCPEGLLPGSGTVIGALEIASNIKARIIGKPSPLMYEMAMERLQLTPGETLAVGDRLETDIAGAQAAGIHTAFVLSGVSTQAQLQNFKPRPEIIVQNLTELIF